MSKAFIGVDPGLSGAIAVIHPNYLFVYPIKFIGNKLDLNFMPIGVDEIIVYIEKVWKPVPLVRLAGVIEGMLLVYGDLVDRVAPSTWRKTILGNRLATKQDAIDYCKKNYPDVSLFPTERSRVENHNYAEAVCIALYAQRKHGVL